MIRDAFEVLEGETSAGHVAGYGIATWAGLEEEAFTVGELLALAAEAAGGHHYLGAIQLPVSLVMMTPIVQALDGRGPLPAAMAAGLRVMASAPLHGGELPAWSARSSQRLLFPLGYTLLDDQAAPDPTWARRSASATIEVTSAGLTRAAQRSSTADRCRRSASIWFLDPPLPGSFLRLLLAAVTTSPGPPPRRWRGCPAGRPWW